MATGLQLAILFNAVLIATCGYALGWGRGPERIGAIINLLASGATTLLRLSSIHYYAVTEPTILAIDVSVVAGFCWLALRTYRFWPIWAFGFALADIVVSLAGGLLPQTPLFAYHTSLGLYAYLALAALTLGTFRAHRGFPPPDGDFRRG